MASCRAAVFYIPTIACATGCEDQGRRGSGRGACSGRWRWRGRGERGQARARRAPGALTLTALDTPTPPPSLSPPPTLPPPTPHPHLIKYPLNRTFSCEKRRARKRGVNASQRNGQSIKQQGEALALNTLAHRRDKEIPQQQSENGRVRANESEARATAGPGSQVRQSEQRPQRCRTTRTSSSSDSPFSGEGFKHRALAAPRWRTHLSSSRCVR